MSTMKERVKTIDGIDVGKLIEFTVAIGYDREVTEEHLCFFETMSEQYRLVRELMKEDVVE